MLLPDTMVVVMSGSSARANIIFFILFEGLASPGSLLKPERVPS